MKSSLQLKVHASFFSLYGVMVVIAVPQLIVALGIAGLIMALAGFRCGNGRVARHGCSNAGARMIAL